MKVLVIGSGPIVIGQAAEFDYAGTQACKSLKEEGHEVVLINSNPATIMTDPGVADALYIEPLNVDFCERVIARERPDALLPTLGGQTGLNLATQLSDGGILEKYNVKLLGTPLSAIKKAEDREQFRDLMRQIKEPVPESWIIETPEQLEEVLDVVPYPCIIRPAYTLGGTGGGIANTKEELWEIGNKGLKLSLRSQIMVERSLLGWKEVEYEVMRDGAGNCITVCNMENLDPMGVHTGDSIVVAPSQTLSDIEYHMLRTASLKIIQSLGIEGGCNVQLAVNPESFDYYIIEVNPRVSRSSALASKATGYPIARVAAKIAVGKTLDEIDNQVTGSTKACFEPALDYCVVKIPRWPFDKFATGDRSLFTQMKATGEVMAIDRTFESALMKAIRGLEIKQKDLRHPKFQNRGTPQGGMAGSAMSISGGPPEEKPIGLRSDLEIEKRQGAYLPHWSQEGGIYSVTYRLADAVPSEVAAEWRQERDRLANLAEDRITPKERFEYQRLLSDRIEFYLDAGRGECLLRESRIAQIVADNLAHFDGERYELHAWAVMPNHVHALVEPKAGHDLASILHGWKSYTAHRINTELSRSGELWQAEYYDHLLRDEADYHRCVDYIESNPEKAGISPWPWVSTHGRAGHDTHGRAARATSFSDDDLRFAISKPTDERLWALAEGLRRGWTVDEVNRLSRVDKWFLRKIQRLLDVEKELTAASLRGGEAFPIWKEQDIGRDFHMLPHSRVPDLSTQQILQGLEGSPEIGFSDAEEKWATVEALQRGVDVDRLAAVTGKDARTLRRWKILLAEPPAGLDVPAREPATVLLAHLIREAFLIGFPSQSILDLLGVNRRSLRLARKLVAEGERVRGTTHVFHEDDLEQILLCKASELPESASPEELDQVRRGHDALAPIYNELFEAFTGRPSGWDGTAPILSSPEFLSEGVPWRRIIDIGDEIERQKVMPVFKMVDTCAGEFESQTPYYYGTFEQEDDALGSSQTISTPQPPSSLTNQSEEGGARTVLVLGSGPIRIGQGIEFDYSCVHCVWALEKLGYRAIIVNNNPETVSTDFDTGDGLYFEPVTLEDVLDVIAHEHPIGVVCQFGGQTAINLAEGLKENGIQVLGTSPQAIATAEDREQFDALLEGLGIPRPRGKAVRSLEEATAVARSVGYPVLVRPSFVLGGRAMEIVFSEHQLRGFYKEAEDANPGQPVLVDKYLLGKEAEVDVISDGEETLVPGIMEHIERAGVHSGDSMAVYPAVSLSEDVQAQMVTSACKIARALGVKGLMNIQFVIVEEDGRQVAYVLEVNPRASRTVPYLSKVTGIPMVDLATRCMMGEKLCDLGYASGLWVLSHDEGGEAACALVEVAEQFGLADGRVATVAPPKASSAVAPHAKGRIVPETAFSGGAPSLPKPILYAIKAPVFSFQKLTRVEPSLGPEMKSTGEILGIDRTYEAALYKAMVASGIQFKGSGVVLMTVRDDDKAQAIDIARGLHQSGKKIVATPGTAQALQDAGIPCERINKIQQGSPNLLDLIMEGKVSLMINTPSLTETSESEAARIRRACIETGVPCVTSIDTASALIRALDVFAEPGRSQCLRLEEYFRG